MRPIERTNNIRNPPKNRKLLTPLSKEILKWLSKETEKIFT